MVNFICMYVCTRSWIFPKVRTKFQTIIRTHLFSYGCVHSPLFVFEFRRRSEVWQKPLLEFRAKPLLSTASSFELTSLVHCRYFTLSFWNTKFTDFTVMEMEHYRYNKSLKSLFPFDESYNRSLSLCLCFSASLRKFRSTIIKQIASDGSLDT